MGLSDYPVEAALAVSNLARAREFYEGQLGLDVADADDQGVRYRCGRGTGIFIYLSPANAGRSPATSAGWLVEDLDTTMTALESKGIAFARYDQPELKTDERGVFAGPGFRAAWLEDPDGNTLAVTEDPRRS
jgi:catechol 2,3-dioxygenase-like lactoylglutathione lyase family enzyme